ncbi:aminoacyl-histidine dipeptidase [Candidatus Bipolaricaulota bacterium]|nr:aminoacyl-histidine dipeptidase [Candidatus Bipolaricaulota bacterium]
MQNLKPEVVWNFFEEISNIPRCSGNEEETRDYLLTVGREAGLQTRADGAGNVLLSKAFEGEEPTGVLQSHMDMVCEKNSDVSHDFTSDPIRLKVEDGWVTAEGTTLGADNGIGMALALAVATGDYGLPPLDFLFTVDEERGLNGVRELDPGFVRGKRLINLDSEEFGSFTVGCAGGGTTALLVPPGRAPRGFNQAGKVSLSGLSGGHSGEDIDRGRANAVKLLGRTLEKIRDRIGLNIIEISGGDKHNAIPREASAYIAVDAPGEEYGEIVDECEEVFRDEYSSTEEGLQVEFMELSWGEVHEVMTEDPTSTIVDLIRSLPFGVIRREQRFPSLVETSTNLASIKETPEGIELLTSTRSSMSSQLEDVRDRIEIIGRRFGAEVTHGEPYPSWRPDYDSELLARAKEVFEQSQGREAEVKAIHGGLETGVIGEKVDGLDMIAMGPDIESPHSPDERVNIETVEKFWDFLLDFLESLS